MHAIALRLAALAGALALATGAAAQSTSPPAVDRAEATTRIEIAPDVTLHTRVADPALLQASRAFDALDRNGDGMVDRGEAAADAELSTGFERVDSDGNGRIDRDEYTAQLRR